MLSMNQNRIYLVHKVLLKDNFILVINVYFVCVCVCK